MAQGLVTNMYILKTVQLVLTYLHSLFPKDQTFHDLHILGNYFCCGILSICVDHHKYFIFGEAVTCLGEPQAHFKLCGTKALIQHLVSIE